MKVKVLKRTKNALEIEVEGAGHSLCNLLQKRLMKDETVDLAGYDISHPLVSNPVIYVRTKDKSKPEKVLERAINNTLNITREFTKEFTKAFEQL